MNSSCNVFMNLSSVIELSVIPWLKSDLRQLFIHAISTVVQFSGYCTCHWVEYHCGVIILKSCCLLLRTIPKMDLSWKVQHLVM